MAKKYKVIITDYDFGNIDVETNVLKDALGDAVEVVGLNAKSEEELIGPAKDADALIVQYSHVGRRIIEEMQQGKIIARYGSGVDIVDVEAASECGIMVTNVPDYCHQEVADHAVTLLLTLIKKIKIYDQKVRTGEWRWQSAKPIYRMQGKSVGIVGFGRIGMEIAKRVQGFGIKPLVYTPRMTAERAREHQVESVSFETLLRESDYIILQAPLTPETKHLLSDREFAMMKDQVILVNTARGPMVDEAALIRALESGKVAGAGLDDIEEEPAKRRNWKPDSKLFDFENVIVTPHAAYYSEESIIESRQRAAEEVARVLKGEAPHHLVNQAAIHSK